MEWTTRISEDTVNPDLTLVSYHYEQQMDGKSLRIDGSVEGPSWTSTLSVGTVVGKIKARIIDNRNSCKR